MSELTKQLRIKAGMINLGERIEWGSETALMETAADRIDHLEAELAKLKGEYEWVTSINTALDESNQRAWGELAKLRAGQEPAAFRVSLPPQCTDKGYHVKYRAGWNNCLSSVLRLNQAPQPSAVPDAVTMAAVMRAWEYAEDHPHKYLRGTTNWCAAMAHSLNQRNPSAPATVQGDGWIPVSERLPKQNEKVLVTYTNRLGNCRRVIAELVAKHTVEASDDCWGDDADYDEATDQYYCPAGWYECVDNWDELTHMVIHEGEVTHWMPLPAAPAIAAARKGEGK